MNYYYHTTGKAGGKDIREQFLSEISQIVLGDASFKIIQLDSQDFADGAWMLRTASGEPFLLFIDAKSAKVAAVKKQPPAPLTKPCRLSDLPKKGTQLARLLHIANETTTLADVKKGSMAEALREGRYLYVYFSTGLRETYGFENHALHLGGRDAKSFLSFCEEFYILNRVSTK